MPELPDVEGFRRVLMSHAVGLPIEHVDVQDEGVLHDVTAGKCRTSCAAGGSTSRGGTENG
jgi:formamidopyrimidine-DNA glycosylase